MAFQADSQFSDFLRATAHTSTVAHGAPAANFLLEERVPPRREATFLSFSLSPTPGAWDTSEWFQVFGNHFSAEIATSARNPQRCATFTGVNGPNLLGLESHRDVVRVESIRTLYQYSPGTPFKSWQDLASALRELTAADGQLDSLDPYLRTQLDSWLGALNRKRDGRPMFATPYGDVEPLLSRTDWAARVRNALGLSHFAGSASSPLPIVLMRYNLSRVESLAKKSRSAGWAATPTVLEAGSHRSGPGAAFFPFPVSAVTCGELAFGATVDLGAGDGLEFKAEFLHLRIEYRLEDFWRFGEVADAIDDDQLADARARHLGLLEADLEFRRDVP